MSKNETVIIKDIEQLKELAKINNPFNTYIRALISEQWTKAQNEKNELMKKIEEDAVFFGNKENQKTTQYKVYVDRKIQSERNTELLRDKQVELDTWDKAKELCMQAISDLELIK